MAGYFKDIWIGVTTIIAGMQVTFRHLFEKAVTIQYPHEIKEMFPRARARLVNKIEDCSCCYKCQRICPVNIIDVQGVRADKDEDLGLLPDGKPKKMHVVTYAIDFNKCLYCGLCVDVCETESLHWEAPQEYSTFTRRELVKSFVTISEEEKKRLLEKEAARKAARAAEAKKPGAKPGVKPPPKPGVKPAPKPKSDADDADVGADADKQLRGEAEIKSDDKSLSEKGKGENGKDGAKEENL